VLTSYKLGDMGSIIGNWIDSTYDRMVAHAWPFANQSCTIPTKIGNMVEFRQTFEPNYRLSERVVFLKYDEDLWFRLIPFESFACGTNPLWFREYSGDKHHRPRYDENTDLKKVIDALAGLFLLCVYPHEMRPYLLNRRIIKALDPANKFPHKNEVIQEILLSHPFVLPNEIPSKGFVGPIVAETSLFAFEFPRQLAPNVFTEKEGILDSRWRAQGN
jgi:hypothetical protein